MHHRAIKINWYKKWHDFRFSHHVHTATALLFFFAVAVSAFLNIFSPQLRVLAANGSWSQTAFNGSNDGTYNNTLPADGGDSLGLGGYSSLSNSGGGSWTKKRAISVENTTAEAITDYQINLDSEKDVVVDYNMDEDTGALAYNSAGSGLVGSATGSAITTGKNGNARVFNSPNGYISTANDAAINLNDNLTVEMWINPSAYTSGYASYPAAKWSGATTNANFVIYYFGTTADVDYKKIKVYSTAGGIWQLVSGEYELPLNQWSHFAWSYNSTLGGQLYINGSPVGSRVGSGTLAVNTSVMRLGYSASGGLYFPGKIDEFRLYRRALSDSEIQARFNNTDYQFLTSIKSDGSDLRFVDSDGTTELPHYVKATTSLTGVKNYKIWIKVPEIPANTIKNIYCYYGNSSASASSNGDNTFLFFDDFNGASLNSTKWSTPETGGTISVSGGILAVTNISSQNVRIESVSSFGTDTEFGTAVSTNFNNASMVRIGYAPNSGVNGQAHIYKTSTTAGLYALGTMDTAYTQANYNSRISLNSFVSTSIARVGTSAVRLTEGDTVMLNKTDQIGVSPTPVGVRSSLTSKTYRFDYMYVKKAVATEPNVALSNQESAIYSSGGTASYVTQLIPDDYTPAHTGKLYGNWGQLTFDTDLSGQQVTVDVLDGSGALVLSDVASGAVLNLSSLTYPNLKLRANLSSSDPAQTPKLLNWSLGYAYDDAGPTSPGNLILTAQSSTESSLQWTTSTDAGSSASPNEGTIRYQVQRALDVSGNPGNWIVASGTCAGQLSATTCQDSGLVANTKYYYRVRAIDAAGNASGWTGEQNLSDDTVGLWRLNEGTGAVISDISGRGNDGNLIVGASGSQTSTTQAWTSGNPGRLYQGLSFDGTDDQIDFGDPASGDLDLGTGDFTIDVWLKAPLSSTDGLSWHGILAKGMTTAAPANTWGIMRNSNLTNSIGFQDVGDAGGAFNASFYANIVNGWNLVTVTREGTTYKIYVDGVLKNTQVKPAVNLNNAANLRAGMTNNRYVGTQMDEIRIKKSSSSPAEIAAYYALSQPVPVGVTTLPTTPGVTAFPEFTSDSTPLISGGSTSPNVTVKLYKNNGTETEVATTTSNGSGNFSFASYSGNLDDGQNIVYVKSFNAENQFVQSASVTVTVDTDAPSAPDTLVEAKEGSAEGATLTNNDWNGHNNGPTVYFNWSGHNDLPIPPNSGVEKFWVYFGSDATAVPRISGTLTDTNASEIVKTLSSPASGSNYYLRIQSQDRAGNISPDNEVTTLFTYKFDNSLPTTPTSVSVDPVSWSTDDPFTFTWTDGADSHSDVYGYDYKRGNGTDSWTRVAKAIPNTATVDHYQVGVNYFLVATVDRAGNRSEIFSLPYLYSGNVGAPQNLSVDLSQSQGQKVNRFKFSWSRPALGGDGDYVGYYYSVNDAPNPGNSLFTELTETEFGPFAKTNGTPNTFFVVAKDVYGNIGWNNPAQVSFQINTDAPSAPQNVSITDASDRGISNWALTVKWSAIENPTPDFDGYEVWRCDAADHELTRCDDDNNFGKRATVTTNIYSESGLDNGTTYSYKVKSKDNVGNTSDFSSKVSRKPTGKFTTPPSYTSEPKVSVKSMSVMISWTTNRASNTIVQYGTGGSYNQEASKSTENTTDHSIEIFGLNPGTAYNYKVQSLDAEREYEPVVALSDPYSFTTLAAPGISNVEVSEIRLTSAIITWKTTSSATSKILYGPTTSYGSQYIDNSGSSVTTHTVKIDGLSDSTTYNFKILGTDVDGNTLQSDNYVFTTLTFPRLSNLKVEQVKNRATSTVSVTFSSNVPVTSQVVVSGSGGREASIYELTKEHAMVITNLKDNTAYTVTAKARDQYGNEATPLTDSYKTEFDTRPPEISEISTETAIVGFGAEAKGQIVVSWTSDEPSTSQIEYSSGATGTEYSSKTQEDSSLTTNHVVIISDLKPSSPYHFRVISRDNAGNEAKSGDNSVLTDQANESVIDVIIKSLQSTIGWIFTVFNR